MFYYSEEAPPCLDGAQKSSRRLVIPSHRHLIRITGPNARDARISGTVLHDLLGLLLEGSRKALRLRVEGRSTGVGTPAWLTRAASFDFLGTSEGSTVLALEAYPLEEVAGGWLPKGSVDLSRSSLSLFEESFLQALAGRENTDLLDQPLLETCANFSRIFTKGIRGIEFINEFPASASLPLVFKVQQPDLKRIDRLIQKTPPRQQVRLAGQLDMIRHSNRRFALVLDSGEALQGVASEETETDVLAELFGQRVVLSGTAVFRPSGSLLRIEANRLEPAQGDTEVWSKAPRPVFGSLDPRSLRLAQGPSTGLNAIFGRWPGDESDAELTAALAEIS